MPKGKEFMNQPGSLKNEVLYDFDMVCATRHARVSDVSKLALGHALLRLKQPHTARTGLGPLS